jgi:hypothetical protein
MPEASGFAEYETLLLDVSRLTGTGEHWSLPDENPPVGLILCSEQDTAVAHYALEGLRNTVLAREYQLALPDERRLAKQIEETHHRLLEPLNPGPGCVTEGARVRPVWQSGNWMEFARQAY